MDKTKSESAPDKKETGSKKKPKVKNDAQLLIRINGVERDEFLALCDDLDTSAAREIRRFIRSFIREHQETDDQWGRKPNIKEKKGITMSNKVSKQVVSIKKEIKARKAKISKQEGKLKSLKKKLKKVA